MSTNALTKRTSMLPSFVDDFFKPWNDWFDNGFEKTLSVPAVNIAENDGHYNVSLAAPGMKKDDFKINLDGNLLTISAEKEETKEEKDEHYNRREYNYSSFSRSFTLPEEVKRDKIEAKYEDGVLNVMLPKNETAKAAPKNITIK
ncbi:MAG TPA: Hsp20/alpha crystallin family protein [Parafilimonas sp.]|nr:Hsp20/alpha crystallin family protein [Parafilimonas sp.]